MSHLSTMSLYWRSFLQHACIWRICEIKTKYSTLLFQQLFKTQRSFPPTKNIGLISCDGWCHADFENYHTVEIWCTNICPIWAGGGEVGGFSIHKYFSNVSSLEHFLALSFKMWTPFFPFYRCLIVISEAGRWCYYLKTNTGNEMKSSLTKLVTLWLLTKLWRFFF